MKNTRVENAISNVFEMLKNREIHPSGRFDKKGRFYAENSDLINVRTPSASYPYSEMVACRTKKYVKSVSEKFNCLSKKTILKHI